MGSGFLAHSGSPLSCLRLPSRRTRRRPRPLSRLERRGVTFLQSEVDGIDPDRQEVRLRDRALPYDHPLSLGAVGFTFVTLMVKLAVEVPPAPSLACTVTL